jgi:hypothetical protein
MKYFTTKGSKFAVWPSCTCLLTAQAGCVGPVTRMTVVRLCFLVTSRLQTRYGIVTARGREAWVRTLPKVWGVICTHSLPHATSDMPPSSHTRRCHLGYCWHSDHPCGMTILRSYTCARIRCPAPAPALASAPALAYLVKAVGKRTSTRMKKPCHTYCSASEK